KETEKAITYFEKALAGKGESGLKVTHLNNLAAAYLQIKDYANTIHYLEKSLRQIDHDSTFAAKITLGSIYSNLSDMYDSIGDYHKAYNYMYLLASLQKEQYNTEKEKTINELETQYRTAEKDKQ